MSLDESPLGLTSSNVSADCNSYSAAIYSAITFGHMLIKYIRTYIGSCGDLNMHKIEMTRWHRSASILQYVSATLKF